MPADSIAPGIDIARLLYAIPMSFFAFILISQISYRILKICPLETSTRILQIMVALLAITAILRPHYSPTHSLHIFALHGAAMFGILSRAMRFRAELEST